MRRDALPEHTDYEDDGCHIHPSCLDCPLDRCIFDIDVRGEHREDVTVMGRQMAQMLAQGASVAEIAAHFGVGKRTVFRYLALEEANGGLVLRRRRQLQLA